MGFELQRKKEEEQRIREEEIRRKELEELAGKQEIERKKEIEHQKEIERRKELKRQQEIKKKKDIEKKKELERQQKLEEELNRQRLKKIEEERLRELAEKKIEEEKRRLEQIEQQKRLEEEKRLKQIEETLKATEKEVAEINKEFEEAGRRRFLAIQKLKETKNAFIKESEKVKEKRLKEELEKRKEVLKAVNILTEFLDPSSDSGSAVETPEHIWKAIIELSDALESEEENGSPLAESLNKVMSAAGRKIRIKSTKNREPTRGEKALLKSLRVETFPL